MLPFQRKEYILERVKQGTTYISDLATQLNVSEITIRRDIKGLEQEGLIELHHGGAVQYVVNTTVETVMEIREQIFSQEKEEIGRFAATLVNDGDVIFVDSGSTTKTLIPYLKDKKNIVLVTNGYKNIELAMSSLISKTILLGGEFKPKTYSFLGTMTENDLSNFYFDKSFIGVNGVDARIGLTNAHMQESSLKHKAIERSAATFTLVDHSKFNKISNYSFASLSSTSIITDRIPEDYLEFRNVISIQESTSVDDNNKNSEVLS